MTVVIVPLSHLELADLRRVPLTTVTGFAVTPALRDTFGLSEADDEEADRTALLLAGLSSLQSHGKRLAVVAEVAAVDEGDPFGEVAVRELRLQDVSAVFADAPEAGQSVVRVAAAVAGKDLDDAWDAPEAQALMAEHDLLWYGPEEIDTLLSTWSMVFFD
jgi:hypothetical protein